MHSCVLHMHRTCAEESLTGTTIALKKAYRGLSPSDIPHTHCYAGVCDPGYGLKTLTLGCVVSTDVTKDVSKLSNLTGTTRVVHFGLAGVKRSV